MPDRKKVVVEYVGNQPEPSPSPTESGDAKNVFAQRRKWPNCCLRCGGDGGVSGFGEVDTEDNLTETLCPSCFGQGKCPRCKIDLPADWREKVDGLYLSIQSGGNPPSSVKCGSCKWTDGDPPVLEIQE
jgi:hypothetical protein